MRLCNISSSLPVQIVKCFTLIGVELQLKTQSWCRTVVLTLMLTRLGVSVRDSVSLAAERDLPSQSNIIYPSTK